MAADSITVAHLDNELWQFALGYYSKPGVERCCLHLQDEYGLSINRIIFSCWCGIKGLEISEQQFFEAARWQAEITHPLRALRYKVREQKEVFPECYQKLRQAELACEQVELSLLFEQAAKLPRSEQDNLTLCEKNVQTYLKMNNLPIDKEITQYLSPLIGVLEQYYVAK